MASNGTRDPLVTQTALRLYDPVCMLDINRDVASGYLILLQGGPTGISPQKKRRSKRDRTSVSVTGDIDDDSLSLAFMSLTDGNVLNACFGAPTQRVEASSPAYQMAQQAKGALGNAAETSDAVRLLAVETYAKAFRIVLHYDDQLSQISPCCRCFKQGKLHTDAEADLQAAFQRLSEAVAAAT